MTTKAKKTAGLEYEKALLAQGYHLIAGLDEAGRGAWAGPVAAAAVILPLDREDLSDVLAGVTDSKLLSVEQRLELAPIIEATALAWAVGRVSSDEIDEKGILAATEIAMERALRKLDITPEYLLIDGLTLSAEIMAPDRQQKVIRGDQLSLSVAAASILAKVHRDAFMFALDEQFPEYGFAGHKGYGTRKHRDELTLHGPCVAHRQTFKPVMSWKQLL